MRNPYRGLDGKLIDIYVLKSRAETALRAVAKDPGIEVSGFWVEFRKRKSRVVVYTNAPMSFFDRYFLARNIRKAIPCDKLSIQFYDPAGNSHAPE